MARQFKEDRLIVASHNPGKVTEIADLLNPFGVSLVSAAELGLPEPVEDGLTFQANAIIKAKAAAETANLPALSDDSGLAVTALNGEPGIYSARWAGPEKDFQQAMQRIETELAGSADRSATFVCALALAWPGGPIEVFEGTVSGTLVWPPRGKRGFGYDPMFLPIGYSQTFGEMEPDHKHSMSHRADAFAQLVAACFTKT